MRENRQSGSEGGGPQTNAASLPLSSSEGQSPGIPAAPRVKLRSVRWRPAQRAKSLPDCFSREKGHATIR
jgi:hypothetical protein